MAGDLLLQLFNVSRRREPDVGSSGPTARQSLTHQIYRKENGHPSRMTLVRDSSRRSRICGLSLSYFFSEQPHESPHDDVESFRAGLNEAMRDHPRRATYASANRSTMATAMFCQSDMVN